RARWIYLKPWVWPKLVLDCIKSLKRLYKKKPDLWLTYHSYYKAPDIIGPFVCRILNIKYIIFQGIYATKPKRRFKTIFGFYLNRSALLEADHVFTNKLSDLKNLKRVIPEERLTYIRPGIKPSEFKKNVEFGIWQRKKWGIKNDCHVILTAGMFRNDVKTQGLSWLIRCCAQLVRLKINFHLVIAGAGKMESYLKNLAQDQIAGHYTFAGKIKREDMHKFYSSGDVFAFPGIKESLGMVYLEAQSCLLLVIAFKNGGIPEVVMDKKTGFLLPMYACKSFS
ncbi:MAG: glycosyltransferase family 4 protein, partial [Desulfobacula sp.]|nr:glycosyltransferase family 4 protein [Desulfobacula sp.]